MSVGSDRLSRHLLTGPLLSFFPDGYDRGMFQQKLYWMIFESALPILKDSRTSPHFPLPLSLLLSPPHHTGTVSGHIVLHCQKSASLFPITCTLPPETTQPKKQKKKKERKNGGKNVRSTPIHHQIRPRNITAEATRQKPRHARHFGGEARALETDGCVLGLCMYQDYQWVGISNGNEKEERRR